MSTPRRSHRPTGPVTGPATVPALALALAVGLGLLCAPDAEGAHPFYERRLTEGTVALEQGRPAEAAHELEIAAFGLLDEPPRLIEALVRLALARARLEDGAAFRAAVRRVTEVEERFGVYREAALSSTERDAFARQIVALTPPAVLERTPALRGLLGTEELAEGGADDDATEPAPAPSPEPESPPPLRPAERDRADRARAILSRALQSEELAEALDLARPLADAHPERPELQQLVGEIAYRSSKWDQAIRYLRRGADPLPRRPELLFYLAVSLYESGRVDEASAPLRRALPRLERTAFVDEYVTKILGPSGRSPSSGGAP